MKRKPKRILLGLLLVLLAGAGWWWWSARDPQLASALELHRQMTAAGPKPDGLREEYSRQVGNLSPEQLGELRRRHSQEETERLRGFFALSPQEQSDYLDKILDVSEENGRREKARQAQASRRSPARSGQPGAAGGAGAYEGAEQRDQFARGLLDRLPAEERALRVAYREALLRRHLQRHHGSR